MPEDLFITPYTKINHGGITDLNVRAKATNYEENFGGDLHDIVLGRTSLDMTLKAQVTKETD